MIKIGHWFLYVIFFHQDEDERDKKYMLMLDGLKLKDIEQGFMSRRHVFALYNPDQRNVYKVCRHQLVKSGFLLL